MKKRLFFTFLLVFTLFLPLSAQVRMGNFSQQGFATQEMTDSGFVAAHSSLPLKTVVKVRNTSNNKEVNATITNRIGASSNRVIDLSPAVYKALELKKDDVVSLSVNAPAVSAPVPRVVKETPEPVQSPTSTVVTSGQLPGINVVVTNSTPIYSGSGKESSENDKIIIINPSPPPAPAPAPVYAPPPPPKSNAAYLAWMMAMTMDNRDTRSVREEREIREARELRETRAARVAREEREEREIREAREARDARIAREEREEREYREARGARTARIAREEREEREYREAREAREMQEAREANEAQRARVAQSAREERGIEEPRDTNTKIRSDVLVSPAAVEGQEYGYLETREFFWY